MSESTEKTTKTKRATPRTELVLGAAAIKMNNALVQIKAALSQFEALNTQSEELTAKIAAQEVKLTELETKLSERKRSGEVEIDLELRTFGLSSAEAIITEAGKVSVNREKYEATLSELEALQRDFRTKLEAEKNAAISTIRKEYENATKLAEAEFKAKEATTTAKLAQNEAQITFLTEQVESWKSQLNAERSASVERSKANAIGSISVGQK